MPAHHTLQKYACDPCKASKVRCSRETVGCSRCQSQVLQCAYSRSGVIRRQRKTSNLPIANVSAPQSPGVETDEHIDHSESHLASDIQSTKGCLAGSRYVEVISSLNSLLSLSAQSASPGSRQHAGSYYVHPALVREWATAFVSAVCENGFFSLSVPEDVLLELRRGQPHRVQNTAWLIIYFSTIRAMTKDAEVKRKMEDNLWLALADSRLLLESGDLNIHALILVLGQDLDFMNPSLCWMLTCAACRMLQGLGVTSPQLAPAVKERRRMMFWHLNLMDKGLAIIFGKSPNFNKRFVREVGAPSLRELQSQSLRPGDTGPSLFASHNLNQKIKLSHIMHSVWTCVYDDGDLDFTTGATQREALSSWHAETQQLLEAAAFAEKPFLDQDGCDALDIGIRTIDFHYLYLSVILTRSSPNTASQCLQCCRRFLRILPLLKAERKRSYHPFIWQLVCCPFTPFLILFRDLMMTQGKSRQQEVEDSLLAMENLAEHLQSMRCHTPLAIKLEDVAATLLQHAKSATQRRARADEACPDGTSPGYQAEYSHADDLDACLVALTNSAPYDDIEFLNWLNWDPTFESG